MAKEIRDIVNAYKVAEREGRQTALATVVHVEGSSYRRPGARMLVEDNGKMTGAISGGCLEGDALRKALLAMNQGKNKLVTYDTSNEEDAYIGVQLGCNGIVHILFEPIHPGQNTNPIQFLDAFLEKGQTAVLITLFSLQNSSETQPGTCCYYDGVQFKSFLSDPAREEELKKSAFQVQSGKSSILKEMADSGFFAFVELLQPALSLIIVGAGNDAMPIVEIANQLGWDITVVDGRGSHANSHRFPNVRRIIVEKPAFVMPQLVIDEKTFVILMTHNYNYDLEMMALLLEQNCPYIGSLGPRTRLERLLNELEQKGIRITAEQRSTIYGPMGIDIGAETSEEIAISVLAEINAVQKKREGRFLKDRLHSIHSR